MQKPACYSIQGLKYCQECFSSSRITDWRELCRIMETISCTWVMHIIGNEMEWSLTSSFFYQYFLHSHRKSWSTSKAAEVFSTHPVSMHIKPGGASILHNITGYTSRGETDPNEPKGFLSNLFHKPMFMMFMLRNGTVENAWSNRLAIVGVK